MLPTLTEAPMKIVGNVGPFALALLGFSLSIWLIIPGPVLILFILSVAGTELWPVLTLIDTVAVIVALRSHSQFRVVSRILAVIALCCSLAPPVAYALHGPYVPMSAFVMPLFQRMSVVPPDAPVVLAIYGGAWERGSPSNDAVFNATIASWGYRVIPLDYPHAPQFHWPAQRDAILRQIDAVHAKRIALIGHSSGAQLAMIAAALRARKINAVVTFASPVDLRLGYEYPTKPDVIHAKKIISGLCGGTPTQEPACYRSASPRYVVHAGMPPVLMIAGGRDHVVDVRDERFLRDELRADGVKVSYIELAWADHSFETIPYGFHDLIALWYLKRFLHDNLSQTAPFP